MTSGAYRMPDDFEDILVTAREETRKLVPPAGADGAPPEGTGEAADGLVRVTAVNGRITAVRLDPKAMRMPSPDLADAFAKAANAALVDLESKYPTQAYPTVDPAALEAQLAEAQELGTRQMRRYLQSITDTLAEFGR